MEKKEGVELFFALTIIIIILLTGTFSYMTLENWSFVDALYFSTSTLSTAGYGDLHPTTQESKLFTIFYILIGISLLFYSLSLVASNFLKKHQLQFDEGVYHFIHKLKKNHENKYFKPPKKHF